MGVRTDVPYKDLTDAEKDIVLHGPHEKKRHILYVPKNKDHATELDFTYYSAVNTVRERAGQGEGREGHGARGEVPLRVGAAPTATARGSPRRRARPPSTRRNLAQVTALSLDELRDWMPTVAPWLPPEMRPMCDSITSETDRAHPEAGAAGAGIPHPRPRQRARFRTASASAWQLARAVRSRTTGVLYVLDEPSIGLHPANIEGLLGVMRRPSGRRQLRGDGGSRRGRAAPREPPHRDRARLGRRRRTRHRPGRRWPTWRANPASRIGPFLAGTAKVRVRTPVATADASFSTQGAIALETDAIHTVHPLEARIPQGRLTCGDRRIGLGQDHPRAGEPGRRR